MADASQDELKACPFCQGPAVATTDYVTCGAAWNPGCAGHMVRTDAETWNTRTPIADVALDDVERLREALEALVTVCEGTEWSNLSVAGRHRVSKARDTLSTVTVSRQNTGASQATGLAGAEAPEPPSRLGPSGGIPSAGGHYGS